MKTVNEYSPDSWVILKITTDIGMKQLGETSTLYKVLGGWSGGYLYGDSWRMNSGITGVEKQGNLYGFYGASGSVYWCHQGSYRLTMATTGIYNELKERFGDNVEIMPEDTDWICVKW